MSIMSKHMWFVIIVYRCVYVREFVNILHEYFYDLVYDVFCHFFNHDNNKNCCLQLAVSRTPTHI